MDEANARLHQWSNGLRLAHIAHARAAASYHWRSRALGIAVVVLTSVAGTTILGELAGESPSMIARVFAGILSLGATVLASLQTFLDYADMTAKHREAERRFGKLRRDAEGLLAFEPPTTDGLRSAMAELSDAWAQLEQTSPTVPQGIHDQARRMVGTPEATRGGTSQ